MSLSKREDVLTQYADARNLDARVSLHERFSINPHGWHPWVFDQLRLAAGRRILEIGCGPGHLWRQNLARLPDDLEAVLSDLSPGMLAEARRHLGGRRFAYVAGDAQDLPFATGRFDAVIANHMLYHVPDRERALAEIRRVLRPGGRFYASTIGERHLHELRDLVAHLMRDSIPRAAERLPDSFTLESGEEEIGRHFPHVELRRYPDALVVTETGPLVAYVRSGSAASSLEEARLAALVASIEEQIARHGAIRITKDSGLFVAS